ncbi:MAG: hypothetical protein IT359_07700 [Gemmatimonadaceae bacterium]|nr:hypothetical protein [Gemmatimonadaceae bacterium]
MHRTTCPSHPRMRAIRSAALAVAAALIVLSPTQLSAQAWAYPSFQPPVTATREFNFGIADGRDAGTSVLFQWREGFGSRAQLSLDFGIADPEAKGVDNVAFIGGQYAYQLTKSTPDVPLDFLLTAGAGLAFGNKTTLRVPVGVSIGHRFPLEGGLALTPYVHPRVSLDFCGGCKSEESQVGINFDVGANFELTRALAIRGSAFFGGSDRFGDDGIGLSLVWTPPGLKR